MKKVGIRKELHVSADYWNHLPQQAELPWQAATSMSTDFFFFFTALTRVKSNVFEVKIIAIRDQALQFPLQLPRKIISNEY